MESFFYAVLGLCGVLLGLQALSSALRILKQDRANRLQQTDQESVQTNSVSRVNGRMLARPWIPYVQSLSGRMVATFTCIVAALGLVTIAMVYFTVKSSLRYHAIERARVTRSEEHTSELQSRRDLVCRLLLEKKKKKQKPLHKTQCDKA